jgi:hypothetical protein
MKKRVWRLFWCAGVSVGISCALACGVSKSSSTTINGTVGGATVPTVSTGAVVGPLVETFGPFTTNGVVVVVSNIAGACTVEQAMSNPANQKTLTLIASSPTPVVAGTYSILTANASANHTFGALVYETTDAQCARTSTHPAHSGSITLSTVGSTTVEGSFDVVMDTGDKLSGTFVASVCNVSYGSDAGTLRACGT